MQSNKIESKTMTNSPTIKQFFLLILGVFAIWATIGLLPYILFSGTPDLLNQSISKWGSLGDAFGMINSLFSGLAFAALLFTLWQQHVELKITREELRQSIEAQRSSASSAEKQIELLKVRMNIDAMIVRIENERAVGMAKAATTVNNMGTVKKAEENLNGLMRQLDQMMREA